MHWHHHAQASCLKWNKTYTPVNSSQFLNLVRGEDLEKAIDSVSSESFNSCECLGCSYCCHKAQIKFNTV